MKPTGDMSQVLFVVGPPGAGKTTAVRLLLDPDSYLVQKPKWTVGANVVAAGHYSGGTFDGADTVGYNQVEATLQFWEAELEKTPLTIFDGDRFSHDKVVTRLRGRGHQVLAVHLSATDDVLAKRRAERGSDQNAVWLKGRVTKAANFFKAVGGASFSTAVPSPQLAAEQIRGFLLASKQ